MSWTEADGWLWWRPPADVPPELNQFEEDEGQLQIAPRLLHPRERPELWVRVLEASRRPTEPYVATSGREACVLAVRLVADIVALHQRGIRLGLNSALAQPASLVRLIQRDQEGNPVLAGGLDDWNFDIAPQPGTPPRLPSCLPCGRASWQRRFAEATANADRTALPDWHALLQAIYYHRTAARLPHGRREPSRLEAHAARTQRQLAPGFGAALRTFFFGADSDVLHWGMGLRAGFRTWLRRLEKSIRG